MEVASDAELVEAVALARKHKWPLQILGGGSNLVLTRDVPGLTIRMIDRQICYEPVHGGSPGSVIVTSAAGMSWHELVLDTLAHGYGGLENLSLIPGTVGAAPVQNIGAYGVELADRFVSLDAWHVTTQGWITLTQQECRFAYRDSLFKQSPGEFVIVRVRLELSSVMPLSLTYAGLIERLASSHIDSPTHRDVSHAVIAIRQEKLPDPARIGNAGSFFQNPVIDSELAARLKSRFPNMVSYQQPDGMVKLAAGWLVESLGYKGIDRNGVGVHEHQALVLVHRGGSTGKALMALADEIVAAVQTRYDVTLNPEPVVV